MVLEKLLHVLQDHYDDGRDKTVYHNTTPDLQDQDQDHNVQDKERFFLVSDRSCPKTDGLRPHHCCAHNICCQIVPALQTVRK